MPEIIRFAAPPRPWLRGVLSVVFAVVAFITVPWGAVGWVAGMLLTTNGFDVWLWMGVTMVGALLGIAAFFLGLAGVIRGPRRLLPAIGLGLSFLPVLALVVLWAIVSTAALSPA